MGVPGRMGEHLQAFSLLLEGFFKNWNGEREVVARKIVSTSNVNTPNDFKVGYIWQEILDAKWVNFCCIISDSGDLERIWIFAFHSLFHCFCWKRTSQSWKIAILPPNFHRMFSECWGNISHVSLGSAHHHLKNKGAWKCFAWKFAERGDSTKGDVVHK